MVLFKLSPAGPFHFRPTLNIKGTLMFRVVHIKNKKPTEWRAWNFTNMINCFCCYVIKSPGEIAKKVLLSIIWNLMFIEINLSQIRISDSKREKVCAVCPYLLLYCAFYTVKIERIQNFNSIDILTSALSFHFRRPTLNIKDNVMFRVVHIRNKVRNDRHGILRTWSIVSVAMLLNQQERPPSKYCYQPSEIYCL